MLTPMNGQMQADWESAWPPTGTQLAYVRTPGRRARALFHWPGQVDVGALRRAIEQFIQRHSVLRTQYVEDKKGEVWAVTLRQNAVGTVLSVIDLSGLDASVREAWAPRIARSLVHAPFEAHGPLFRIAVMRLSAAEQVLVFSADHSLFDAWSATLMTRELAALYRSAREGKESSLPPLTLQFSDYAREQREWLASDAVQTHLQYWRHSLAGARTPFWLPTDPVASRSTQSLEIPPPTRGRVSAQTLLALQEFTRRQKSTLFVTLATAFGIVLARWSGCEDTFLWIAHWGRMRAELRDLVGPFFDVWLLRMPLSAQQTFAEAFALVKHAYRESLPHQCLPGAVVRAELDRAAAGEVFPTVVFNYLPQLPQEGGTGAGGGRKTDWVPNSGRFAGTRHALGIGVSTLEGDVRWEIGHAAALFHEHTVERVSDWYAQTLQRIADDPHVPLAKLLETPQTALV
jgi:hypothetical protein